MTSLLSTTSTTSALRRRRLRKHAVLLAQSSSLSILNLVRSTPAETRTDRVSLQLASLIPHQQVDSSGCYWYPLPGSPRATHVSMTSVPAPTTSSCDSYAVSLPSSPPASACGDAAPHDPPPSDPAPSTFISTSFTCPIASATPTTQPDYDRRLSCGRSRLTTHIKHLVDVDTTLDDSEDQPERFNCCSSFYFQGLCLEAFDVELAEDVRSRVQRLLQLCLSTRGGSAGATVLAAYLYPHDYGKLLQVRVFWNFFPSISNFVIPNFIIRYSSPPFRVRPRDPWPVLAESLGMVADFKRHQLRRISQQQRRSHFAARA